VLLGLHVHGLRDSHLLHAFIGGVLCGPQNLLKRLKMLL
jgi:hypothetical protein